MIMKSYKYSIILLIALLQGCNVFDTSNKIYPEAGIADDGLIINFQEFHEDRDGSDPEPYLTMRTKRILECSNYFIVHDIFKTEELIDIRLLGVDIGSICATSLGPATSIIPFDGVEGTMELVISDGDYRDRFEVNVTREKADITPIDATFAVPDYARYYRKPENSFHFNCRPRDTMTHLCQDFHDVMVNELEIVEFEFPDDGLNPYTRGYSGAPMYQVSRFYTYTNEDEFHKAGELLESFTHENIGDAQGNSLSLYNWRSTAYLSWAFQN
jgi:hypothetical protein